MTTDYLSKLDHAFTRWLGVGYDLDAIHATLAAAAVSKLDGDLLWLLLVSGPGNAKTETVTSLGLSGAHIVSTIASEGALLSATSKGERASDATGGLLRAIGDCGVLVLKDFTSILSLPPSARPQVLAALREIYDGSWTRTVGADGGRKLEWSGRIAAIGAVTTAWDSAHQAVAEMGDRFVLLRMDSREGRMTAGLQAIQNTGSEKIMRTELAEVAATVLAGMSLTPIKLSDAESSALLNAADLVTLARTAVMRDGRGEPIDAHAPEMPTRFAKQLAQIVRGGVAIGMDRVGAVRLAMRCARDSIPPLRLIILEDLAVQSHSDTSGVAKRVQRPRNTVDRELRALQCIGLVECDEVVRITAKGDERIVWQWSLREGINPHDSVPEIYVPPQPQGEGHGGLHTFPDRTADDHGSTYIPGTEHTT